MAAPVLAEGDIQPRAVADLLDSMVQEIRDRDREVARILADARDRLRVLGSNRYAARLARECTHRRFVRRHKREG